MRKTIVSLSFLLALLVPVISHGQEREKILSPHTFRNTKHETLPYRLFVPQNYDRKKKYPLVVYLHGGGGVGDDNLKQINGGNGYLIDFFTQSETQTRYPLSSSRRNRVAMVGLKGLLSIRAPRVN